MRRRLLALAALSIVVAACDESVERSSPTGVFVPTTRREIASLAELRLLECPSLDDVDVGEIEVGANGGGLESGRQRLRVPGGAVLAPTRLAMRSPASTFME